MKYKSKPSKSMLEKIKEEEEFRSKVYDDLTGKTLSKEDIKNKKYKGNPTIGFGDKLSTEEIKSGKVGGENIYKGITKTKALDTFSKQPEFTDTARVIDSSSRRFSQKQKDAFFGMGFNTGPRGPKRVIDTIEEKGLDKGISKLKEYNKGRDKEGNLVELKGLTKRRVSEANLIQEGQQDIIDARSLYMGGTPKPTEEEEEQNKKEEEVMIKATEFTRQQGGDVNDSMPEHLKERTSKRALNVDNIEKGGAAAQQAQLEGKQPGIDDKFMSALGFFLPAVIGGIVGGQEGRAGAGVKLGLMASGEYHKAKNAHEELQLKKQQALAKKSQSKVDITPDFYDTETGNPIFSRQTPEGSAEFIDDQGKVIPASQVRPLKEKLSKAKQGFVQSRHQERMTEGYMKTWRKKADKDIEGIKNIDSITNLIESGSPITTAQVATFNARALFNEVGRLSDQDVDRAVVGLPLYKKVKNNMHQYMTGTMTDEVKTITKELLRVSKKHQKGVLRNLVDKGMVQHRIKQSGLTEDQFRESLLMEAEVDLTDEEEKKKKKGKMSAADRAELKRLQAKYPNR